MNLSKNFGLLGLVKVETIPLEDVEIFAKYQYSDGGTNRNYGPFNDDCNLGNGSACYPETAILDGGVSGGSTTGPYLEPTLSPYP